MTDKRDGKRWGWWMVALLAVLLLAAYVLSYGPAARYAQTRPAYEVVWFDMLYAPAFILRSFR